MTTKQAKNVTKNLYFAIIIAVVGNVIFPAVSFAKTQSLTFLDISTKVDYTVKETSLSYFAIETSTKEDIDPEKLDHIKRLDAYFEQRDMPLAGYGAKFVEVAEKCDIDWRLLPAIGVRESSGGKHMMNNNPFGWGSAKIKFDDFDDAIENVSDHLCGLRDATSKYYKDTTTYKKLWYYNGTVLSTYPREVMEIMDMM